MTFTRAIVRPPGASFAEGLTTSGLGPPRLDDALAQHERYCAALRASGLEVVQLAAAHEFPDSTFVEDTAVVTSRGAIITRPGAPSRAGEADAMRSVLAALFRDLTRIEPPGTLDGGDVCQIEDRFLIGLSARTNADGARQLAEWLRTLGYSFDIVDVRSHTGLLHLKSGMSYLGDGRLMVVDALAGARPFQGYQQIRVPAGEEYAANCVRVNDRVLVPNGFPAMETALHDYGYATVAVEMSEFRKMDGGLTCLSLRF